MKNWQRCCASDEQAVDRYLEYVDLHALLSHDSHLWLASSDRDVAEEPSVALRKTALTRRRRGRRRFVGTLGVATIFLAVALATLRLVNRDAPSEHNVALPTTSRRASSASLELGPSVNDMRHVAGPPLSGAWPLPKNRGGSLRLLPVSRSVMGSEASSGPWIPLMPARYQLPGEYRRATAPRTLMPTTRPFPSSKSVLAAESDMTARTERTAESPALAALPSDRPFSSRRTVLAASHAK